MLLINEVNTLREIRHQNIIEYVDRYIDTNKQRIYMIMQYCDGGDLEALILAHKQQKRFIAEDEIWYIMLSALKALQYCHFDCKISGKSQQIIH